MEKVISFSENLDMFKHLVLLYKDEKGNTYLGSSSHNEKGSENRKNHIILYKEPLPIEEYKPFLYQSIRDMLKG